MPTPHGIDTHLLRIPDSMVKSDCLPYFVVDTAIARTTLENIHYYDIPIIVRRNDDGVDETLEAVGKAA